MGVKAVITDLLRIFPGAVETDVKLSSISCWRIGGTADVIVTPRNTTELSMLRAWIYQRGLRSVVIGATSNLLFADEGVRAVVIRIGSKFSPLAIDGTEVVAGPGVWVPSLARKVMLAKLAGLEHICGIPGTLGGLICMNGGSQRKGIGDHVTRVQSVDVRGEVVERNFEQCGFAYRTSIFKHNDEVISEVNIRLRDIVDSSIIRRQMLAILRERRMKFPRKLPNCGSTFVSNPAMYADYGPPGKVIENAGFKGYRIGGAVVSSMHANFIVNDLANGGGASARDVLQLISSIKQKVAHITGYNMQVEVRYVSPEGTIQAICE